MDLKYKTNEMGDPQGKPKVYFACHPDDFAGAFPLLSDDILEISDCAVWYDPDPSRMPGSEEEQREFEEIMGDMQLFVFAVTTTFLEKENRARSLELPFAIERHIPILPIMLGLAVKRLWPRTTEQATSYLPALSSIAICLIVLIVIAANARKLLSGGLVIVAVVMLHNILGLAIGYLVGLVLKLPSAKRRAISVEVGMQNSGLASSLATLHFAAYPMASIPGAVFSVWHNISGAIVARIYSSRSKAQVN